MVRTIEEVQDQARDYLNELMTLETLMHNIMYSKTGEDLEQMSESLCRHLTEEKDLSLMNYRDLVKLIAIKRSELEYGKLVGKISDEIHSFAHDPNYI